MDDLFDDSGQPDVGNGGEIGDWADDQLSWEDSERFDGDDSICSSPYSDAESVCQNWRGWSVGGVNFTGIISAKENISKFQTPSIKSLVELCAKEVARSIPFELVETFKPPVPEPLQLRIAYWSFPENENDIRLYSCLANGSVDEFHKGESLNRMKTVQNLLQIGFHLSAMVQCPQPTASSSYKCNSMCLSSNNNASCKTYNVNITMDRCKIVSCTCTCNATVSWCSHIVAVCLNRIQTSVNVCLRAPVSESLSRLNREQLQKFAQYLISDLPRHFLPTAQRLLDALLTCETSLNGVCGAPDPTAGASLTDVASWCFDDQTLRDNIRKILCKFCQPTPTVCDVNYLATSTAPPVASEWQTLLRPLRGREPEGLWNLLSIVREMYKRSDNNAVQLLRIITDECLACDQVVLWWFHTKLLQSPNAAQFVGSGGGISGSSNNRSHLNGFHLHSAQYSCAFLLDEIVQLWRLAVLNPRLTDDARRQMSEKLRAYHEKTIRKLYKIVSDISNNSNVAKMAPNGSPPVIVCGNVKLNLENVRFDLESFPGFKSALEACFFINFNGDDEREDGNPTTTQFFEEKIHNFDENSDDVGGEKGVNLSVFVEEILSFLSPSEDVLQISFARCESYYWHGFGRKSVELAVRLADEFINGAVFRPVESGGVKKKRKSFDSTNCQQTSSIASTILTKSLFLCQVLKQEEQRYSSLAFQLAFWALELPRHPSTSKFLEVKLNYQETEIVSFLKEMKLGPVELNILRSKAEKLCSDGGNNDFLSVLPISLAFYVSECLCDESTSNPHRLPTDEQLGFDAAVTALTLKSNVAETEYPLLCEGIRRQKGDLAMALLLRYKDDPAKLTIILDRFLDSSLHKMYKNRSSNVLPFLFGQSTANAKSSASNRETLATEVESSSKNSALDEEEINFAVAKFGNCSLTKNNSQVDSSLQYERLASLSAAVDEKDEDERFSDAADNRKLSDSLLSTDGSSSSGIGKRGVRSDSGSTPPSSPDQLKNLENYSDDKRRVSVKQKSTTNNIKFKKSPALPPPSPYQPSEAHAHFMIELAKRLLTEAGGNHSTVIFTTPARPPAPPQQTNGGPHRALHLCAFKIGLYALGLHNKVNPNWMSRTYSSHVSWISGQAMEIGRTAVRILTESWQNHLTPSEVANLADKTSQSRDASLVQSAAELALSVLPYAHALNPTEIQRALTQCKEQNAEMLEKACAAVEQAARGGGVYPEVLFYVAQQWYLLYVEVTGGQQQQLQNNSNDINSPFVQPPPPSYRHRHRPQLTNVPPRFGAVYSVPPPNVGSVSWLGNFRHEQQNYTVQQTLGRGLAYPAPQQQYLQLVPFIPGLHPSYSAPNLNPLPLPAQRQTPVNESGVHHQGNERYLFAAYTVGILAMEAMGRRIDDERSYGKYAQSPPYADDVKWLSNVARKLGASYVQEFCSAAVQSIVSPYVLWDLAVEAALYFSSTSIEAAASLGVLSKALSHPFVQPLFQKCLQTFYAAAREKLSRQKCTQSDFEELCCLVRAARTAFLHAGTNGNEHFNAFLQSLRRQKACKKDLWNKLMSSLSV